MSLTPYRQGRLDSLCGIYALINAFSHARRHDPLRYFPTKRLFMTLVARMAKIRGDTSFCGDGIDYHEFRKLAKAACRFHREDGHQFELLPPKVLLDRPYPKKAGDETARREWFRAASELPSAAVILDINTPWISHWSVLVGVKEDRLLLFDSNGMRSSALADADAFVVIKACRAAG
ncbi:hypothetical protein [Sinorhizobium sp. M4_45]|uniref:hypothetical protein n=1 Tax=Sinorhizobium sp. M4_45 TaxID=2037901 RepID=UPI000C9CD08A|nr:hypothetical protein [Sinorhizobium sp. M4_45]PND27610.1 hypothetical protein CN933_05635 [Sinorhizobium sp. M4_45]